MREVELKFLVPREGRAALLAEVTRQSASPERRRLAALYLDTPDRRLAAAGMAWRLRREGRRWIQTLKSGGGSAIERFEHEVIRPGPVHDAVLHAGSRTGDKLAKILRNAEAEGLEVGVRFQTDVRRIARRIRTKGAVVEVAFDEGTLLAGGARLRISEVEFELVSGSASSLLALAERWRKRFGLLYDPRSKAERGDRLAEGSPFPPLRKAARPEYPRDASALDAFGKVLDESHAHICRNVIGLIDGDRALRVEHVHQLRVGIRRLRSGLRSYRGWVPEPPAELVEELKRLFTELGRARDSDVLDSGVAAHLKAAGAPPLTLPKSQAGPDPAATVGAPQVQKMLLAWLAWRVRLQEGAGIGLAPAPVVAPVVAPLVVAAPLSAASVAAALADSPAMPGQIAAGDGLESAATAATSGPTAWGPTASGPEGEPAGEPARAPADNEPPVPGAEQAQAAPAVPRPGDDDSQAFPRKAQQRLRKWHRQIVAAWKSFDQLDEEQLHLLRKLIKRQRYAVEFFAPLLRRRDVERYLKPLQSIQDRMGELNDLFVARTRYQAMLPAQPAAWFAVGWLAARIVEVRAQAKPELKLLAKADPPA